MPILLKHFIKILLKQPQKCFIKNKSMHFISGIAFIKVLVTQYNNRTIKADISMAL